MIKLSESKVDRLAEICADIGTVALASVALPAVLDKVRPFVAIGGLLISGIFWVLSVLLTSKNS